MDKKRLAGRLMITGGIIEIAIGILHFVWPVELNRVGLLSDLSGDFRDLLILASISIGLCVLVFGTLSIFYSKKLAAGHGAAWVYGISQGILWEVRAIFELMFPVKVPMFFISNPTVFVLPFAILLGLVFLAPLLIFKGELVK
jgi:hypothetical protein